MHGNATLKSAVAYTLDGEALSMTIQATPLAEPYEIRCRAGLNALVREHPFKGAFRIAARLLSHPTTRVYSPLSVETRLFCITLPLPQAG